ncbi:L-fuculose-phosphate aldolase [Pseudovibrio sp. Tun.PSC04-5.I4]|uniref:L-fuculose-phosphate aldolase n=1 Tax=Pseudovibrio sp. Tun.PSC04-5.I4 TaxID=1798213 RepID=UPI00087E816D|nr:L-fuculose-phosphate aldolase [Pseudovibrio sp. Tun.PSC04-5.I4]SDQ18685.1 L-fuculose 1-phosphate aldolase [Pseudovibrio sp. Tun.PSC04-5.I4]
MSLKSELSAGIIKACREMNRLGLNQGTAGNISCRYEDGMLISASGIPYEQLEESDLVFVSNEGKYEEGKVPSSEWRFHLISYLTRPDVNAVVHTHAMHSSTLSILNKKIPAIHYMIAAGGGKDIPCVPYATYGTPELSEFVAEGLKDRNAILLQHHGLIATGASLAKAMWLTEEVETLAKMYMLLLQTGLEIPVLPDEEIEVVLKKFDSYGLREKS